MKPKLFSASMRWFYLLIVGAVMLLAVTVEQRPVFAGFEVDCEASARAYKADGIPCWCKNNRIVCNQSGGSLSGSSSRGLSPKNQMQLQMLQGVMDGFVNAFIRWINSPPPTPKGPTPEQIAAEQERVMAEWRAKVQQQINEMTAQYDEMKRQETQEKKAKLLAGMKGTTAVNQLSCAAYWAGMAKKALEKNDEGLVRKYNTYAANPDSAPVSECNNALPQPPMPPSASEIRSELFEMAIEETNIRLPLIQEARAKQLKADQRVAEKQKKVDELKTVQTATASVEDQQAADDLLAAAMKELEAATTQKNEADAGVAKLQLEIDALSEVGKMATDTRNKKP